MFRVKNYQFFAKVNEIEEKKEQQIRSIFQSIELCSTVHMPNTYLYFILTS